MILKIFYSEIKSVKTKDGHYSNSSLKTMRVALNRYFKQTRSLDIISNPLFFKANNLFGGVQHINKEEGQGTVKHKNPIFPEDLEKLHQYFIQRFAEPPNAYILQQFCLFNIIYYMGQRGRENLCHMKKDLFAIDTDPDGHRYIFQALDESDKNHSEKDFKSTNEGRIYEIKVI